jgi:hypothetical protein
MFWVQLY